MTRAEIYDGETFDARLAIPDWSTPLCSDKDWMEVVLDTLDPRILRAPDGPSVKRIQTLSAVRGWESPSKKFIIDFGQNLVGWVRCKLYGPRGHTIKFTHTEVLENGECATKPLREARCTDTVILNGEPIMYEPRFTFHGFRYLQIDGWPHGHDVINIQDFTAIVVHTDMIRTGWFEFSDSMLNRLHENVVWSMRGNFLAVPTDCPQRDERLGWTGDLQAFASTASFIYDDFGMLKGWLRGLTQEQLESTGVPPLVSPDVFKGHMHTPAAIWGDALISIPWDLYRYSGDKAILMDSYRSMTSWIQKGIKRDQFGLWDSNHSQLGDWLDPAAPPDDPGNGRTDELLVANAFLIMVTDLMAQISLILGHESVSQDYTNAASTLREHFARKYITTEGRVVSDTQTALALAIHFSPVIYEESRRDGSLTSGPHNQSWSTIQNCEWVRRNADCGPRAK